MFVLRLIAVLAALAGAVAFALFLYTRNRRYLDWARRIVQFIVVVAVVVLLLYLLERVVVVV